jgi:hypothetical protein
MSAEPVAKCSGSEGLDKRPETSAMCLQEGIVRNRSRGGASELSPLAEVRQERMAEFV